MYFEIGKEIYLSANSHQVTACTLYNLAAALRMSSTDYNTYIKKQTGQVAILCVPNYLQMVRRLSSTLVIVAIPPRLDHHESMSRLKSAISQPDLPIPCYHSIVIVTSSRLPKGNLKIFEQNQQAAEPLIAQGRLAAYAESLAPIFRRNFVCTRVGVSPRRNCPFATFWTVLTVLG
jgi:hypothetical protein